MSHPGGASAQVANADCGCLDIVIFGLSITSSWGNGHATTYRALVRALAARGHRIRFFERDRPWYADNRDLAHPSYCEVRLYSRLSELEESLPQIAQADLVMIGSYVPDAVPIAETLLPDVGGVSAFYDIDTPVTVAELERGECTYLTPALVPRFDLYFSFAGGPILKRLQARHGARRALPLYCSVEPTDYFPVPHAHKHCDLGYLGTYSADRQPTLERLLVEPARQWPEGRFCVAGAQYPRELRWPDNVARAEHLPPSDHRQFYNDQRFALNVTRADMRVNGYSPSVRLFEAAACGVPIITDDWPGLDEFFTPGEEIVVAHGPEEVLAWLRDTDPAALEQIAARARARVLAQHTAAHRAIELEAYVAQARMESQWTLVQGARTAAAGLSI